MAVKWSGASGKIATKKKESVTLTIEFTSTTKWAKCFLNNGRHQERQRKRPGNFDACKLCTQHTHTHTHQYVQLKHSVCRFSLATILFSLFRFHSQMNRISSGPISMITSFSTTHFISSGLPLLAVQRSQREKMNESTHLIRKKRHLIHSYTIFYCLFFSHFMRRWGDVRVFFPSRHSFVWIAWVDFLVE